MTAGNHRVQPVFPRSIQALSTLPENNEEDVPVDNDSIQNVITLSVEGSCPSNSLRRLKRLVSQEEITFNSEAVTDIAKPHLQYISGGEDEDSFSRLNSPLRCVSDFDKAVFSDSGGTSCQKDSPPPLPNPLDNPFIFQTHKRAIRLEAELFPMRQILSRLMSHLTYNRKGIFNVPVDPVALGLPDYHIVVTRPMDLGTIKSKLHSLTYQSRDQVCDDIRLVFQNSMKYNPPGNAVHIAAQNLLKFFEEDYLGLGPQPKKSLDQTVEVATHKKRCLPVKPISVGVSVISMCGSVSTTEPLTNKQGITRTISREAESLSSLASDSEKGEACVVSVDPLASDSGIVVCQQATTAACRHETESLHNLKKVSAANAEKPSAFFSPKAFARKRKLRSAASRVSFHSCQYCRGRVCAVCEQGCVPLEPIALICNGANCAGAKIRKGATYYIAEDGSRQYCQKCFIGVPTVITQAGCNGKEIVRYKRDLLKRKNDEEMVESWLTCSQCDKGVHSMCAMHNDFVHSDENYVCPTCSIASFSSDRFNGSFKTRVSPERPSTPWADYEMMYTFLSGCDMPVPMSDVAGPGFDSENSLTADALSETKVSAFIQRKVRERLASLSNIPNLEKTITVRIISDCSRSFIVPDVIRKHFCMSAKDAPVICTPTGTDSVVTPPTKVNYQSKAIALFQKVDGLDVCIFCMYVHEYDGDEEYDDQEVVKTVRVPQRKRVYIAYLDSVEHFQPRRYRTSVYHEILVSYLATARSRGYETAHIWACPPSRGNFFVFWNHPASQRTPSTDRLLSWYHGALSRAIDCGVVTDIKSLYESDFKPHLDKIEKANSGPQVGFNNSSGKMVCPPLLDGDFWMEEAVRIHSDNLSRHQRTAPASGVDEVCHRCPAGQVARLLRNDIIANPSSAAFRRPVNAAALKLKDYHNIITNPMDLGTVYSRCILGEYYVLRDLVADVELVFSNARKFNPVGHIVHSKAVEMECLFFDRLNLLTSAWYDIKKDDSAQHTHSWRFFADISMSLDMRIEGPIMRESVSSTVPPNEESCSNMEFSVKATDSDQILTKAESSKCLQKSLQEIQPLRPVSLSQDKGEGVRPTRNLDLTNGGPEAVNQRMAGEDIWLLDKNPTPPKHLTSSKKKSCGRRKRNSIETTDDSSNTSRRQTWLGEEVAASVRKMRNCFFRCSLLPESCERPSPLERQQDKPLTFLSYTESFEDGRIDDEIISSRIADVRHALLEFSQYRNFEFDTLRHAKYSTTMLLYHLHHHNAPGIVPSCTSCGIIIQEVRWHKVKKVIERRRVASSGSTTFTNVVFEKSEELCSPCHGKHQKGEEFVPLPVSFKV